MQTLSRRPTFARTLERGRVVEGKIATFLRNAGYTVIPAYEKEIGEGKGPQVFTPDGEIVAPDILVIRNGVTSWVEAKCKTVFTWHRISQQWVTGIDLRHYFEYLRVAQHFGWDIYLLFLHEQSTPDARDIAAGCPASCPTGLFAGSLHTLSEKENHRHENWGKHGMVYWAHGTLEQVEPSELATFLEKRKKPTYPCQPVMFGKERGYYIQGKWYDKHGKELLSGRVEDPKQFIFRGVPVWERPDGSFEDRNGRLTTAPDFGQE